MSRDVTRCSLTVDSVLKCEPHKKPKRKRHRNRSRNSNLKKKRPKKFYSKNKPSTAKSHSSNLDFVPESSKIMSNWYWSNYKKALEWQEKHRTAQWKACALSLLEENRYLLQIINQLHPAIQSTSVSQNHLIKGFPFDKTHMNFNQSSGNISDSVKDDDDDDDDEEEEDEDGVDEDDKNEEMDDVEFEMSKEMMEFFERSYKHKMELNELKKKESLYNAENEIINLQNNKIKRTTEMNLLYGDGASMIIGMETAVQLSFEKYCDMKSPKFWPNIPFRL